MRLDSVRADRITAAILFALGAAMAYGGYAMDRLEIRQIHPASIPGLVPMMLGTALMICAILLYSGTRAASRQAGEGDASEVSWTDLACAAGWSCFYALVLVGPLPFAVATGIYLAVFTAWFKWRDGIAGSAWTTLALVAVFAILASAAISALFRYGFLVRLP